MTVDTIKPETYGKGSGMPLFGGDVELESFLRQIAGMPLIPEDRELPVDPTQQLPEEDEEIEEEEEDV